MHPRSRSSLMRAVLLPALFFAAAALSGQSILLAVQETVGGVPTKPPLPLREALVASLFDAGFIVMDFPGSDPVPTSASLVNVARSGGADLLLEVRVDYENPAIPADALLVSGRSVFTLTDVATGAVTAQEEKEDSNKDREKEIDRIALGAEMGRSLATRIEAILAGTSR